MNGNQIYFSVSRNNNSKFKFTADINHRRRELRLCPLFNNREPVQNRPARTACNIVHTP
jgi:hypothetical protein